MCADRVTEFDGRRVARAHDRSANERISRTPLEERWPDTRLVGIGCDEEVKTNLAYPNMKEAEEAR